MEELEFTDEAPSFADFDRRSFSAALDDGGTATHDIYSLGKGPPIVVLQELPGLGRSARLLAARFVEHGFTAHLVHLLGPIDKRATASNSLRALCMRRELSLLARGKSSPLVSWLRALCRDIDSSAGPDGVGVIGMCLTGNFALSLIADASVLGAVSAQPSLPAFSPSGLHMSREEVVASRRAIDEKGHVLAYRFEKDWMCGKSKFRAIGEAFNDEDRTRVRLVELPGRGHAVLTDDLTNRAGHPTHQALCEVVAYFNERLR